MGDMCTNELWFFNTETINWFYSEIKGNHIDKRFGHSSVYHNQSFYIFGGINKDGNYCNTNIVRAL